MVCGWLVSWTWFGLASGLGLVFWGWWRGFRVWLTWWLCFGDFVFELNWFGWVLLVFGFSLGFCLIVLVTDLIGCFVCFGLVCLSC